MNQNKFDQLLPLVQKPGRYSGGEYGQVVKDKNSVRLRFAFCFPDTYEIGMSNLGIRILYGVLNARSDVWCERAYAPWGDMESLMRERGVALAAHESGDALSEFDIVGFTLQYELCYTNVLAMLDLGGIPLRSADRGEDDPVVIGGGPCTCNSEPVADFFDIILIGEGEEAVCELADLYILMKENGEYNRAGFLRRAANIPGFYVPSLYKINYNSDGTIAEIIPGDGIPAGVTKRIVRDLDSAFFPENLVMPYIETVHDRITLEVFRGCPRGCRFCQAGMVYRPVRSRSPAALCELARNIYDNTGYDEISLGALSISDYRGLGELCRRLLEWTEGEKVSLSLPSLRADSFDADLMSKISSVRSGSLTFAPEAGTQRLRDIINKNITEDDILRAAGVAFAAGKNSVKLYFMLGLPGETDADLDGIAELASKVVDEFYKTPGRVKRPPTVTVSVSCFVPKPHTPFQWEPQASPAELKRKQEYLKQKITDRKIKYNYHDAEVSQIEAVFARGGRKLSYALELAFRTGVRFDAWDECFDYNRWMGIFRDCGIDPAAHANRRFDEDEILPWDMINCGVKRDFLRREAARSRSGVTTPSCMEQCSNCGADCFAGGVCET